MTLFAFASTRGAPGVTTTLLGLAAAWPTASGRPVLVLEADPDGGVLASRFEDLRADRTLADVAVDTRRGFDLDAVMASSRQIWGGLPVVVAPPSSEHTHTALSSAAERLATGLAAVTEVDVLVDLGRLTVRSPALPFARRAAATIFVCRPSFEAVASLSVRVPELAGPTGCSPEIVTIGDRPYQPADIERVLRLPVVGALPDDARVARVLAGGSGSEGHLRRSLLWRSLVDLASRLALRVTVAPTPDPPRDSEITEPFGADPLAGAGAGVAEVDA
jgi:hypothetical protein